MAATAVKQFPGEYSRPPRVLASQAISRSLGAFPTSGNHVSILRNADENYSAWLQAISCARRTILFENYFVHADQVGREFVDLLTEKAREGVDVRIIHDWVGSLGRASARFWRPLRKAGAHVVCFNPPRLHNPLSWLRRDHRKMLAVDGSVGFVSGLCVGSPWIGDSQRGIEAWRDTGLRIEGPALADLEIAFREMWRRAGGRPIPRELLAADAGQRFAEGVSLRVVSTHPNAAHLYRFDQLIAAIARNNLWLTDAYFVGTAPYMQALSAAARDGVDVRVLLPRSSDLPIVRTLSRTGYRMLLEAGVRVFEWNGPMLHAKTAVADGRWARIGSSNMNLASWLGNWELDVVVEDENFAEEMQQMYLEDLSKSTEIVLSDTQVLPIRKRPRRPRKTRGAEEKAKRAVTRLLQAGTTVQAVVTNRRPLEAAEVLVMSVAAVFLLLLAAGGLVWPLVLSSATVLVAIWIAASLLIRVCAVYMNARKKQIGRDTGTLRPT